MKLLTKKIRKQLPKLYSTENEKDPVIRVKFFSLWSDWRWYATEFDGDDLFFGLVDGFEREWGYFSLAELQSLWLHGVRAIERDLYFRARRLSQITDLEGVTK